MPMDAHMQELAARKSEAQTCLAGLIEALRNAGALASAELIRAKAGHILSDAG
jgi:hypothetical protein